MAEILLFSQSKALFRLGVVSYFVDNRIAGSLWLNFLNWTIELHLALLDNIEVAWRVAF